ncbi:CAP domain-containing protein [Streptomyces sp. H28]|nr:CAP domain-containing protein [Streptomyces sp. H28]
MGIAPYLNPAAYAETYAKSEAYLYATGDAEGAPDAGSAAPGTPAADPYGVPFQDSPAAPAGGTAFTAPSSLDTAVFPAAPDVTHGPATQVFPADGITAPAFPGPAFPGHDAPVGAHLHGGHPYDGHAFDGPPQGVPGGRPHDAFADDPLPGRRFAADPFGPDFPDDPFPGDPFAGEGLPEGDLAPDRFSDGLAGGTVDARHADEGLPPGGGVRRAPGHRRRKKKTGTPVRSGLLGVSAAVAIGTVAVATGAVPGLENYKLGGDSAPSDGVQAGGVPTNSPAGQGGASGSLESPGREAGSPASRDGDRATSPEASPSAPAAPAGTPEKEEEAEKGKEEARTPSATPDEKTPERKNPPRKADPATKKPANPGSTSAEQAASAQVLRLVNQERAKVGCRPVAADNALAGLAKAFSDDMAERGFFDHTDPDGATPWDRAAEAGIADLGGENIARGQLDAAAVMEAWMNSPGHKANILNCDFKTLGVGVHMGPGGPWWTQNFGY